VVADRLLLLARELEARDERLAAAIAEVGALQRSAEDVRERALAVEEFLERLPLERETAETALGDAQNEAHARSRALADAEDELARAEQSADRERVAAARRELVRAGDAAASAERKLARAREALEELARRAESLRAEAPRLAERARGLAGELARLPRISGQATAEPAPGLEGTVEWGSRARAALLVVRSGLDTERERVVREANELAASALGEPVAATSVSLVRERIERR
jgi:chromosome segregation ATPase